MKYSLLSIAMVVLLGFTACAQNNRKEMLLWPTAPPMAWVDIVGMPRSRAICRAMSP